MKTTIKGKVIDLDVQSGKTSTGKEWTKKTVVVETQGEYAKTIPIGFFNKEHNCSVGDYVSVEAFVSGFNYKGNDGQTRYGVSLDGASVERDEQTPYSQQSAPPPAPVAVQVNEEEDDLPF